jgi:hypothetical protein
MARSSIFKVSMPTVNFTMDDETMNHLKTLALESRQSMSAYLRLLVAKDYKNFKRNQKTETQEQPALLMG